MLNFAFVVAVTFVCIAQTLNGQVAIPSTCFKVDSSDTKLSCLVDPESGLRVQYLRHPDICSSPNLQCSSSAVVSCSLAVYESAAQGCFPTTGQCIVLNESLNRTNDGSALMTISNSAAVVATVTVTIGA